MSGTLVSHGFEEFCLEQEAGGRYQNRHLYNDILKARTEYGCERLVLDIPLAGSVYHIFKRFYHYKVVRYKGLAPPRLESHYWVSKGGTLS